MLWRSLERKVEVANCKSFLSVVYGDNEAGGGGGGAEERKRVKATVRQLSVLHWMKEGEKTKKKKKLWFARRVVNVTRHRRYGKKKRDTPMDFTQPHIAPRPTLVKTQEIAKELPGVENPQMGELGDVGSNSGDLRRNNGKKGEGKFL